MHHPLKYISSLNDILFFPSFNLIVSNKVNLFCNARSWKAEPPIGAFFLQKVARVRYWSLPDSSIELVNYICLFSAVYRNYFCLFLLVATAKKIPQKKQYQHNTQVADDNIWRTTKTAVVTSANDHKNLRANVIQNIAFWNGLYSSYITTPYGEVQPNIMCVPQT